MKKNVASQDIGAQMITASDGTAFTGTVSVDITEDGGTQTGGAGTGPTHEGNGYHGYVPTQGETDADHIAFTFTGTGAIPVTIQVFTDFPQTGDNFARLGAPAGASVSADIAVIEGQTDDIGVAGAGLTAINLPNQTMDITGSITGNLSGSVGSVTAAVTVGTMNANVINSASIDGAAMDGKGNWNIGKAGYALSSAGDQSIADLVLPPTNTALSDIPFLFVAASDHVTPVTGATGTAVTRSIDGAAFGAGTGTISEIANGIYQYDASAADVNGKRITFRFTASGGTPGAADDTFLIVETSA